MLGSERARYELVENDSQCRIMLSVMALSGTLDHTAAGAEVTIRALEGDERELAWLRAIGLFEGQRVRVLRRASFGGPLHVRVASGGEFAVDRTLAGHIGVEA